MLNMSKHKHVLCLHVCVLHMRVCVCVCACVCVCVFNMSKNTYACVCVCAVAARLYFFIYERRFGLIWLALVCFWLPFSISQRPACNLLPLRAASIISAICLHALFIAWREGDRAQSPVYHWCLSVALGTLREQKYDFANCIHFATVPTLQSTGVDSATVLS